MYLQDNLQSVFCFFFVEVLILRQEVADLQYKNRCSFASKIKNQEILLKKPVQYQHFLTLLRGQSFPLIAYWFEKEF